MFKFIILLYRFFLKRRYKVTIKGIDAIKTSESKLILPNHQALVDPQLIFTHLYKYIKVVPVASEEYANNKLLKPIFNTIGVVSVSDISANNRDVDTLKKVYVNVTNALKNNKNVLLYPSGQIAGQGYEKIFNKQSAFTIVNNLPENTKIIGIRINGLWGSMWSRAWVGKSPNFFKTFLKAIWYIFINFIFFLPKRNVNIEIIDITEEAIEKAKINRITFNLFLEEFYNKNGEENVNFIKHYFFTKKIKRTIPERIEGSVEDLKTNNNTIFDGEIPAEIFRRVSEIVEKTAQIEKNEIKLNSNLNLDLNIDSLLLVAIISEIESEYQVVSQFEITNIKSIEDLCRIAMNQQIREEYIKPSFLSTHHVPLKIIEINSNKNILELFIKTFNTYKTDYFAYDKIIGSTSRKDFFLKAMIVSKIIKKEIKENNVGIMLPALQSTSLLVIATYLAGKTPVMLNWTVGKKVLDHCVETSNLKAILTAKSFFEKVQDLLSDGVKQKCVFLEQKVKDISIFTKINGLICYKLNIVPHINMDDTAVILFTSGSESLPKAVALTHKNIISDLWGTLETLKINNDRIFLGFLPPFHSFGFTVLTILPLITGLKVAYTPDPTDNRELLKILKHTKANTILGTPTFLKMLLAVSLKDDFKNVDLAITGAESLSYSIIKTFYEKASPKAKILEGYGITECSPVLSINTLQLQKEKSVGKFITGVDYLITNITTNEPLPTNSEGMILVKGNNVFNGYLDKNIESPFVSINGNKYYKTGDLGKIDDDAYLFITGRLKRFIKIAGEMISLPAIENALLNKYGNEEEVVLAIEGSDSLEPPKIVLFSKYSLPINDVNAYLKEIGFSSLIKINDIIVVDEIPLLGTGKTDYKMLKAMIN